MSEPANNGNHDPLVAGVRRLVYVNLAGMLAIGLLLSLPWLGVGYCIFVGGSSCPAILSPQMAQVQQPSRDAPAQVPRASESASRIPAAPLGPVPVATKGNRPTANPKYVALVIGNTNYPGENKLKNPGRDAIAIAETLKDLNYTVVGGQALLDVDRRQMVDALADFGVRAAGATVAIVYYAGHGIQIDEKEPIYLIPIDAELKKKSLLPDEGIPLSRVTAILPNGPNQYGLVILDACRTSKYPLDGLDRGTRGTGLRGLKAVKAPNRAFIAFSASAGEEAADGEGTNSPYATALLKHMKDKDAPDVKAVFARVQDDFRGTDADQSPGHDDRLGDRKIRLAASQPLPPVGKVFRDCPQCPEMVVLPAGKFLMGAPKTEYWSSNDERPQHEVGIASIAIATHEVTFAEWDACIADGGCKNYRPSDEKWGRDDRPVINVSWDDAQEYVKWLSNRTYNNYRLLTEAEWEYAARAGSKTVYPWGDNASHDFANYGADGCCGGLTLGRDKWEDETAPVGQFPPNKFGLFDMHGNVWEWTQDCSHKTYVGAPANGAAWESGECSLRVLRGGSWDISPGSLRSAVRFTYDVAFRNFNFGFRVARAN